MVQKYEVWIETYERRILWSLELNNFLLYTTRIDNRTTYEMREIHDMLDGLVFLLCLFPCEIFLGKYNIPKNSEESNFIEKPLQSQRIQPSAYNKN